MSLVDSGGIPSLTSGAGEKKPLFPGCTEKWRQFSVSQQHADPLFALVDDAELSCPTCCFFTSLESDRA